MIVVADRLPESVRPGDALALDVHVVSDLRAEVDRVEVVGPGPRWAGGERRGAGRGDLPADACERVGTLSSCEVPDAAGPLTLELTCRPRRATQADNRYDARDRSGCTVSEALWA